MLCLSFLCFFNIFDDINFIYFLILWFFRLGSLSILCFLYSFFYYFLSCKYFSTVHTFSVYINNMDWYFNFSLNVKIHWSHLYSILLAMPIAEWYNFLQNHNRQFLGAYCLESSLCSLQYCISPIYWRQCYHTTDKDYWTKQLHK